MEKSKALAVASFIFGLISIFPLINYITIPLSIYFGAMALRNIKKHPSAYNGKGFAITGLVISILTLIFIMAGIGICLAGSKSICSSMGFAFLN